MSTDHGYARALVNARVKEQVKRSVLGKAYLYLGQCPALQSYFFQLGGILAARHMTCPEEFALAFLGITGESGAIERFFGKVAEDLVCERVKEEMTIQDFAFAELLFRAKYEGDVTDFLRKHGKSKTRPETAVNLARDSAELGAAVGSVYPHFFKEMFERTHAKKPESEWDNYREMGLAIPDRQEVTSYAEVERDEDGLFKAYGDEVFPEEASILWAGWPNFTYPWPGGPSE